MNRLAVSTARGMIRRVAGPMITRRTPRRLDPPLETWGLAIGPEGGLVRGDIDLASLTRSHGSPLVVVDADRLECDAREAIGSQDSTPRADVFYSYKTNPIPAVLAVLHRCGIGAEVISPYELWLALRLGVPGERIIYNGPAKSSESLRAAIRAGVSSINANSSGDLALIRRAAQDEALPANVGLRVSLPTMWQGQFGFRSTSPDLSDCVRAAMRDPMLELRSIHAHRGFTLRTAADFTFFVGEVLGFCDVLRSSTGFHPAILDLGGSLACPTVASLGGREFRLNRAFGTDLIPPDPSTALSVASAGELAVSLVSQYAHSRGLTAPRVVLEPGRALTSSSQMLMATVHDVKTDGAIAHAVLDAGVNVAEPTSSEYHHLLSVTAPSAVHDVSYRVVGPICTPADVLYNSWRLPRLEPGHVLAIMDAGAYFVPFSTSFSFPRPAVAMIDGNSVRIVRDRETFEHLIALDRVDGWPLPTD